MFSIPSPGFGSIRARSRRLLEEEGLHEQLEERFCKTLYYGELPSEVDTPSLPLTKLAVEYFKSTTPRGLGHVDMHVASSLTHDTWISPGSIVTSLIYAKRLRQRNQEYLQTMSSSDLFFISVMMASKYMYDEGVDEEVFNDEWAEAGNLETEEVNKLERDFLSAMDWQLFVSRSEFLKSVEEVQRRIAWTQGCTRGWLSYTDIDLLCTSELGRRIWPEVATEWIKVISISSAAYVAGLLTMLGSTALAIQMSTSMVGYAISCQQRPSLTYPKIQHSLPTEAHFDQPIEILDTSTPTTDDRVEDLLNCNKSKSKLILSERFPQAVFTPQGHIDTVLNQLWAVVAFKDTLIHLMCAFSEGLQHTRSKVIPLHRQKINSLSECSKNSAESVMSNQRIGPMNSQPQYLNNCEDKCLSYRSLECCGYHGHPALLWNSVKSTFEVENGRCHGSRPPDLLNILLYPDVNRGFSTGIAVTA